MKALPETNHAGCTIWRVNYRVARRRIRKTFHSKEEADAWIACNRTIAVDEGRIFWEAWHGISNVERHELMDALALMRDGRIDHPQATLVIAAKEYLGRLNAVKTSVALDEAVEGFLASKAKESRKGGVSEDWLYVLETSLRRVVRELPNKTLVEFSTEEIESYLDDQDWSPRTFNNNRNYLKDLFNWGAEEKYVAENPVTKIETFSKKMLNKEVIVPAVNVVGRILKASDAKAYRHLRPAIDAGFGLALRSSEITGMDWRNVTEKVFHVPASIAKNGKPRNIQRTPLLDGVFRSLHNQHQGGGPLVAKGWRRELTNLFEEVELGKPRNIMRKSGASYHFHATGSEEQTQELMGHTEDSNIFSSAYKALRFADADDKTPISQDDGKAYYRLWK